MVVNCCLENEIRDEADGEEGGCGGDEDEAHGVVGHVSVGFGEHGDGAHGGES